MTNNFLFSPADNRDFKAMDQLDASVVIPDEFDPRKNLLPIRNQNTQGSCVAMSLAAIKEIQEKKNINFEDYFSPQFIYNLRSNYPSEGMYPRDAFDILLKNGIIAEEEYNYNRIETADKIPQVLRDRAQNYKIHSYAQISEQDELKRAILENGACLFTINVFHDDGEIWKPKKQGDPSMGGHALSCVGWNKEGFIVRNSWGSNWGWDTDGYAIFPYSDWIWHGEIWTCFDDSNTVADPYYTKWYWKFWRGIKNTFKNTGALSYMGLFIWLISSVYGYFDHQAWFISGIILVGMLIYTWLKKLYLVKV